MNSMFIVIQKVIVATIILVLCGMIDYNVIPDNFRYPWGFATSALTILSIKIIKGD